MFPIEMKHIGKIGAVGAAQVFGYSARNRLTDARNAVYHLLDGLPMRRRIAAANIYSDLCCIQGRLEKLLEDVPTVIHVEMGGNGRQK